jgi:hypothetical protein
MNFACIKKAPKDRRSHAAASIKGKALVVPTSARKQSSLSAGALAVSKLLALQSDPAGIVIQALEQVPVSSETRLRIQSALQGLSRDAGEEQNHRQVARLVEQAYLDKLPKRQQSQQQQSQQQPRGFNLFVQETKAPSLYQARQAWDELTDEQQHAYLHPTANTRVTKTNSNKEKRFDSLQFLDDGDTPQTDTATLLTEASTAPLAVSDVETTVETTIDDDDDDDDELSELTSIDFWNGLIESVYLQVATLSFPSKSSPIFTTYPLNGMVTCDIPESILAKAIHKEIFSMLVSTKRGRSTLNCRVYVKTVKRDANDVYVWVQLNFGYCQERLDKQTTVTTVFRQDGECVAVTSGKSRMKYVPMVLTALEAAATCSRGTRSRREGATTIVGELSGEDPRKLLQQACNNESRVAIGRFADAVDSSNPLLTLQSAATKTLMSTSNPTRARAGEKGDVLINHDISSRNDRKRKRDSVFGKKPPVRTCLKWELSGSAAEMGAIQCKTYDFKMRCRVTVTGKNVLNGMKHLMDAGIMKVDGLPDYIRNAPHLGPKIKVVDGLIVETTDK